MSAKPPWVQAAPFRAHLEAVIAESGIPWPAVALMSGVSTRLVQQLLFGKDELKVERITAVTATRLLRVSTSSLQTLRKEFVPSRPTQNRLLALLAQGEQLVELAQWCQLTAAELLTVLELPRCTKLVELMTMAACLREPLLDHRRSQAA